MICKHCGEEFSNRGKLRRHEKAEHPDKERKPDTEPRPPAERGQFERRDKPVKGSTGRKSRRDES